MQEIHPPQAVTEALRRLQANGFDAYAVGGCVRDSLLGRQPPDWDITTNAEPTETQRVFADCKCIETGLRHGTVTIIYGDMPLEITTYRVDGAYADNRHPNGVTFTCSLPEDLQRRDFTVNTLCWHPDAGIIDLCGGMQDLKNGVLRAVGTPNRRFQEDALRILRGMRFAAVLGFTVEPETAAALLQNRQRLSAVSAERIRTEFVKLLCGKNAAAVLERFQAVLPVFLPEIEPVLCCPQNTVYHKYDVFRHTLVALENIPPEENLRLCMFFHDFGKPLCRTTDADGTDHFKGHEAVGAELVQPILQRLRFPKKTVDSVTRRIAIHDTKSPKSKVQAKQLLSKIGVSDYRALIQIKRADNRAKAQPHAIDQKLAAMEAFLEEILENNECFSRRTLAVSGRELQTQFGLQGEEIRAALDTLLHAVIADDCPNEQNALLAYWKKTTAG